jgi:hypothetical protein
MKQQISRSRDGVALSRSDLPKLVQLLGPGLTKKVIPCFGPEPNYAGKAALTLAKSHRTYKRGEICAE